MTDHTVVSRDEWIAARLDLLAHEKELTRLRDRLSVERRALPWVRVDKDYVFEGPGGQEHLGQLFDGKRQLIVQHFMFGPDWEAACKSCSFWADNYNGIIVHLAQRDVSFVAVSLAPFARIDAFRRRMGWNFKWVSSAGTSFNYDYHVSFAAEAIAAGEIEYNFVRRATSMTEHPGTSVFYRDQDGAIFHTYSCYARGLDAMNAAYQYLDLVPLGRNESGLPFSMAWVRHHDSYDAG